mgnify:CR=1 FL=1
MDRIQPEHIRPLREVEREHIERAILACRGDLTLAAAHLGVSKRTVYYRLKQWRAEDGRAGGDG